jgi:enamine deaminase RidA (YjgF/YER057c/UK114 family)
MPIDVEGQVTAPGDLAAQTRHALANLQIVLEDAGATIRDVLKITVYVASSDRGDLIAAWEEVKAVLRDHNPYPPGTCVGVAVLACEGQLVEIEAIAAIPGSP